MRTGIPTSRIIALIVVGLLLAYYALWMAMRYSLSSITDILNLLRDAWIGTQYLWNAFTANPGRVIGLLSDPSAQLLFHVAVGLVGILVFIGVLISILFGKKVTYHAGLRQAVDAHLYAILMKTPGYTPNASAMQRCTRCGGSPPHPHRAMFYFGAWYETNRSTTTHDEPTYRTVTRSRRTWNSVTGEYDDESYDEEVFDGYRTVTTTHIEETFKSDGRFPLYLCASCASRVIAADRGRGAVEVAGSIIPRLIGVLIVAAIILMLWQSAVNILLGGLWGVGIDVIFREGTESQRTTYIMTVLAGVPIGLIVGGFLLFRRAADPLKRASPLIVKDFLFRIANVIVRPHQREVSETPTATRERIV